MKKKLGLTLSLLLVFGLLTGCSIDNTPITQETASGLWETVFVYPLAWFITFLYNLFNSNLGFAIIVATALVRLVLMPIYAKSNKSMAVMQVIQPEMQRIQKKYENKKDQASQVKMQKEMTDLYKEYNYNPMMGCLLPFLQMPIFFAFYQAIYRHPLIQNVDSNFFGIDLATTQSTANIILAIIVAGLTLVSQRMMSKSMPTSKDAPGAAANNTMMKVMNIYFPFAMFSITFATNFAFGLYFLTGSIMTILQYVIVKRPGAKK
ncbi:MAG TPA: stage III sporulation protein J [Firmicutes bacterium]|nr:stage III sporulation protein J [Bacillota bacterium]